MASSDSASSSNPKKTPTLK